MVKLILIILFIPFLSFGQGGVNHHKTTGNIISIDSILSTYRFTQIIAPGLLYCNPNYDSLNSIALIGGKLLYKSCRCAGWDTVSGSGGGGSNIGDSLVVIYDSLFVHWSAIMSKIGYTDTTAMLSNYLAAILGRVKYTDTLAMLSGYGSLSRSNTFTATQNTLQNIRVNQMKVKGTATLSANQYRTTINGDGHILLTDTTGNLKIDLNPVNGTINVTWGRNSSSDNIANSTPFRSVSNGPSTAGIKPNFFYIQDSITGNLYVIMPVYGYGTTADSLRGIGGLFLMSKDTGRASSHGFKLVTVGLMDSAFEHFSGGIGGTIAANQIVYGNGVNTVEGNSSFSYDPSGSYNVGFPTVGDYLELDPSNGIFRIGDYHDDLYGNSMTIGRYSTLLTGNFADTHPGAVGLNLSFHDMLFKIGDIQGFGNSTLVTVDDPNNKVNISGDVFADNLSGTNTGDQTITLIGDVTGTGSGSFSTTLKNTGTAGTYGDATHIPSVTTDAQGRITGITTYTFTSGGGGTADTIIAGAGIAVTGQAVHSYTVTNSGVITETDPIFTASGAFGITSTDKTHWTQAYDKYLVSGSYSSGTITFTTRDGNTWTVTGLNQGTVTSVASADGSVTVTNPSTTVDLAVVKAPKLTTARTIGGVLFDGTANITVQTATGGFTVSGGNLACGSNSITLTGSLASTGSRCLKGWFTDLDVTNTITGSVSGSAATWTTARNLAGNSVNGSANVAFANKFIVQGTTDAGLSGAQFLGALSTGILKNTTTTGVLSIAANSDLPAMSATVGGAVPTPPNDATKFLNGQGGFTTPAAAITVGGAITSGTNNTYLYQDASGNLAELSGTTKVATFNGSSVPTAVTYGSSSAVSTMVSRDASANSYFNNVGLGFVTVVTAVGTSTYTVDSAYVHEYTGTSTHTVTLPVTSTIQNLAFIIYNNSTGSVTVKSSGGTTLQVMVGSSTGIFTVRGTGHTDATDWIISYQTNAAAGAGTVTSVTSATGDATVATTTTTPVITIVSAPKLTTARTINGTSFDGTANIAIGGTLFATQVLSTGTTYTPTSGTTSAFLILVGGGGGGGGVQGAASKSGAGGGGGSGGIGYARITSVSGTYTYAIGAAGGGGAGATPAAGTAGGNTTFANGATTYTAFGGSGGQPMSSLTTLQAVAGGAGGVVSTNCDENAGGAPGGPGITVTSALGVSGNGGSCPYGGGGLGLQGSTAGVGNAATGFGGGGGGGLAITNTNVNGGTGTKGVIYVFEYK